MMDIEEHKRRFDEIITKYGLDEESKAGEVADFLTRHDKPSVSAGEFAKLFGMEEEEAVTFLSFIERGLRFKQDHLDQE